MISCFFSFFFSISLGLVAGDSQIVCAPVEIITPTVHSPIYINESSTDREIYEEKHDEIWRKECSVEREWGGEVEREREKKQEGGGREGVNSCFLIKQQRSQLIHLICQLEEKHGRNLFTWRRVGGGITERKLLCKKSLEKKQNGEGFVVNGWGNDKKARVEKKIKKIRHEMWWTAKEKWRRGREWGGERENK